MKKNCLLILYSLIFLVIISGCINIGPRVSSGRWESTDPPMYIDFDAEAPLMTEEDGIPISGINTNIGELFCEDGTSIKINIKILQGQFYLYRYREDGEYSSEDSICSGICRLKGESLILKVNSGPTIILHKVDESETTITIT